MLLWCRSSDGRWLRCLIAASEGSWAAIIIVVRPSVSQSVTFGGACEMQDVREQSIRWGTREEMEGHLSSAMEKTCSTDWPLLDLL